eukprot:Hpha_TRINITY_DN16945_c3_g3::TRINITY_DN16945_c3_g3_i1::g.54671::m.54671
MGVGGQRDYKRQGRVIEEGKSRWGVTPRGREFTSQMHNLDALVLCVLETRTQSLLKGPVTQAPVWRHRQRLLDLESVVDPEVRVLGILLEAGTRSGDSGDRPALAVGLDGPGLVEGVKLQGRHPLPTRLLLVLVLDPLLHVFLARFVERLGLPRAVLVVVHVLLQTADDLHDTTPEEREELLETDGTAAVQVDALEHSLRFRLGRLRQTVHLRQALEDGVDFIDIQRVAPVGVGVLEPLLAGLPADVGVGQVLLDVLDVQLVDVEHRAVTDLLPLLLAPPQRPVGVRPDGHLEVLRPLTLLPHDGETLLPRPQLQCLDRQTAPALLALLLDIREDLPDRTVLEGVLPQPDLGAATNDAENKTRALVHLLRRPHSVPQVAAVLKRLGVTHLTSVLLLVLHVHEDVTQLQPRHGGDTGGAGLGVVEELVDRHTTVLLRRLAVDTNVDGTDLPRRELLLLVLLLAPKLLLEPVELPASDVRRKNLLDAVVLGQHPPALVPDLVVVRDVLHRHPQAPVLLLLDDARQGLRVVDGALQQLT